MSTNAILVSVIIPHFNDLLGLNRCLIALESQTLASDKFEIIVADNNSNIDFSELEKCIAGRAKLTQVHEQVQVRPSRRAKFNWPIPRIY